MGGDPDAPFDPCRMGYSNTPTGDGLADWSNAPEGGRPPSLSYEYFGYAARHENMVSTQNGDGNQGYQNLGGAFWSQEGDGARKMIAAQFNVWGDTNVSDTWSGYSESQDTIGAPDFVDRNVSWDKGETLFRNREGIERFFITDINNPAGSAAAQSESPVMWDLTHVFPNSEDVVGNADFNHIPGGGNVLCMDGHVEYLKYPGEFPVVAIWVYRANGARTIDYLQFSLQMLRDQPTSSSRRSGLRILAVPLIRDHATIPVPSDCPQEPKILARFI